MKLPINRTFKTNYRRSNIKIGRVQIDYERKLDEIEIEKLEIEKQLKLVNLADEQLNCSSKIINPNL